LAGGNADWRADLKQKLVQAHLRLRALSGRYSDEIGPAVDVDGNQEQGVASQAPLPSAIHDVPRPAFEEGASARESPTVASSTAGRPDPERTRKKLLWVRDKINSRSYAEAEAMVEQSLSGLKLNVGDVCGPKSGEAAIEWAYRRPRTKLGLPLGIEPLIRILIRFQLIKLYRAEAARCVRTHLLVNPTEVDKEDAASLEARRQERLAEAEHLFHFATEIMRYVEDPQRLIREQAILRSNTGTLLSRLGRHTEAHRKYSEAYGYLSHDRTPSQALRFATVDMRRVDTFLCQLQEQASPERGRRLGLLYDAIASVDRAAYKARGQSVSAVWYSYLHELEISVCVELAFECQKGRPGVDWSVQEIFARCRDGGSLGDWFVSSLDNALFYGGADPFRCARFVDLTCDFLSATDVMRTEVEPQNLRAIHKRLVGGLEKLSSLDMSLLGDPNLERYAGLVRARVTRTFPELTPGA
jgi:hypothetical protein